MHGWASATALSGRPTCLDPTTKYAWWLSARLYHQLSRVLADGTPTVPDFAHALRRHTLIVAIEQASATGSNFEPSRVASANFARRGDQT
jgi:hypothetical protein